MRYKYLQEEETFLKNANKTDHPSGKYIKMLSFSIMYKTAIYFFSNDLVILKFTLKVQTQCVFFVKFCINLFMLIDSTCILIEQQQFLS